MLTLSYVADKWDPGWVSDTTEVSHHGTGHPCHSLLLDFLDSLIPPNMTTFCQKNKLTYIKVSESLTRDTLTYAYTKVLGQV